MHQLKAERQLGETPRKDQHPTSRGACLAVTYKTTHLRKNLGIRDTYVRLRKEESSKVLDLDSYFAEWPRQSGSAGLNEGLGISEEIPQA